MKRGKKYKRAQGTIEKGKRYSLKEALYCIKKMPPANFDESLDLDIRLGVNPKDSSQMVRGTIVLPHGRGKEVKVLVFARGEKAGEANEAGADFVGAADLVEKIKGGWLGFNTAIATPDIMKEIAKLGRILAPRGLMPNPKVGTVTQEIKKAVKEAKAGRIEYKMDSFGNLHLPFGKKSFKEEALLNNARVLLKAVLKSRPPTTKGQYLKGITLSSTMGPAIGIDRQALLESLKEN